MINPNKRIAITITGRVATCVPAPTSIFESLRYAEQAYQFRNRKGSWRTTDKRLYVTNDDGSAVIPTGSVPRIETELRRDGYEICVHDRTNLPAVIQDYDHAFYDQLNVQQRRRGDEIANRRQFVMSTTQEIALETMGWIARLYPGARIFVALPSNNTADFDRVLMAMAKFVGGNVGRAMGLGCHCEQRVAIGSFSQFATSNPDEWHIVVFPYLDRGVTNLVADGAGPFQNHRMFGFIDAKIQLSKRDVLRLEILAGPLVFDHPGGADASQTVTAVFCSSRSVPIRLPPTALERKRLGIWYNEQRNRLIAEVSEAIANADQQVLCEHFLVGENDVLLTSGTRSVAILVESLEHGRELARLLPGWQLVALPEDNSQQYLGNTSCRRIITATAASLNRNLMADVMIRADGGANAVGAPHAAAPLGSAPRRAMIVDFVDDFEESFLRATQSRALAYRRQGFSLRCPEWLLRLDPSEVHESTQSTRQPRKRQRTRST